MLNMTMRKKQKGKPVELHGVYVKEEDKERDTAR
jgi:hypothetical protein